MGISSPLEIKLREIDLSQVPEGMDLSSTFELDLRFTSQNRRKDVGYYAATEYVDSERTNLMDFKTDLYEKYPWGPTETAHLSYYDSASKSYVSVRSDQDMMLMFEKFKSSRYIVLNAMIAASSASVVGSEITYPGSQPTAICTEITCLVSQPIAKPTEIPTTDDTSYLANPFLMFEHVGINDEVLYGEEAPTDDDEEEDVEDPNMAGQDKEEDGSDGSEEVRSDVSEDVGSDDDLDDDWVVKVATPTDIPKVAYDKDDPPMLVGSIYPSIEEFRVALAQHSIKHEFEYDIEKTDPERLRANCVSKEKGCKWRIHASVLEDKKTIEVKKNPFGHTCGSRQRSKKMKNVSKAWICEKVKDWVRENAAIGAKELQRRILETHFVQINYKRVHAGYQLALDKVYGDWKNSFDSLYSWKDAVEKRSPDSVVIIEHHEVRGKKHFRRLFVAFKTCVDGFLKGCRPYLSIDSTFLTGRFRGQLAAACAVDGHNWLFPVAYAIMECEDGDNWEWFMQKLHDCIGDPSGLAICTDAGKGLSAVKTIFREAEHRECMRHLATNFKKRFHDRVFDENLWPAAYAWQPEIFEGHMSKMVAAYPEVHSYLTESHPNLWTRSKFNEFTKVDYVTNNLAESFNNWIRKYKAMHVGDLCEKLRQKLMIKFDQRRTIGNNMSGLILPHICADLKEKSHGLKYRITRSGDDVAEVFGKQWTFTRDLVEFKHVVDLKAMTCTCREWQITGKPCLHAIAFITHLREENLQIYVDSNYSIEKFRYAYQGMIPALTHKNQWPKPDKGFFLYPPLLGRSAGRPRIHRIKGSHEPSASKKRRKGSAHECPICKQYGHHWNTCREGDPEAKEALALLAAQRKAERMRKAQEKKKLQIIEGGSKRKRTTTKKTMSSKRVSTTSDPNQIEAAPTCVALVPYSATSSQPTSEAISTGTRKENQKRKDKVTKSNNTTPDSPAMGTRSKKKAPDSPAMRTRSKKKLIDII